MSQLLDVLCLMAALAAGLVAGIFFAFSTFVMRALGQLPPNRGIAAMQAINITVLNPWFLATFFGTGVVCLGAALVAWDPRLVAGCGLYLVGCLLVTMICNVPWNDRLAAVDAESDVAHALWARYLSTWTRWNHVRTAASLVAAGLFVG